MDGFAVYTHHHDHEHDSHGNVVPLEGGCQHWDEGSGCRQEPESELSSDLDSDPDAGHKHG